MRSYRPANQNRMPLKKRLRVWKRYAPWVGALVMLVFYLWLTSK